MRACMCAYVYVMQTMLSCTQESDFSACFKQGHFLLNSHLFEGKAVALTSFAISNQAIQGLSRGGTWPGLSLMPFSLRFSKVSLRSTE